MDLLNRTIYACVLLAGAFHPILWVYLLFSPLVLSGTFLKGSCSGHCQSILDPKENKWSVLSALSYQFQANNHVA